MNRNQKSLVIDALKDDFTQSQASFLVGIKGLTVSQVQILRKELRVRGGALRVAKARLMKRAVDGLSGVDELSPFFKDQVGLVFVHDRVAEVAKLLTDFAKQHQVFRVVVGCVDEQMVPKEKIAIIATLPSREVLLAQVCGTLKSPIANFVNVLNIQLLRLLWTLKQVGEKKS
jgi:large subunit ribosomal protein L10